MYLQWHKYIQEKMTCHRMDRKWLWHNPFNALQLVITMISWWYLILNWFIPKIFELSILFLLYQMIFPIIIPVVINNLVIIALPVNHCIAHFFFKTSYHPNAHQSQLEVVSSLFHLKPAFPSWCPTMFGSCQIALTLSSHLIHCNKYIYCAHLIDHKLLDIFGNTALNLWLVFFIIVFLLMFA